MPASDTPLYRRWYLWIIPVALVVILVLALDRSGRSEPTEPADTPAAEAQPPAETPAQPGSPAALYAHASDYVSELLRDPSRAQFPPPDVQTEHVSQVDANTYRVDSYVDAPDATGVMKRVEFILDLQRTGEDWQVMSLTLDGKRLF